MKNYIQFIADRTLCKNNGGVITNIKAPEAVDIEQLIAKSNSYVDTDSKAAKTWYCYY